MLGESRSKGSEFGNLQSRWWKDPDFMAQSRFSANYLEKKTKHRNPGPIEKIGAEKQRTIKKENQSSQREL
jgi:hypothetical protein